MIGVVANQQDSAWVAEFFELFKTPWEIAQHGRRYDALFVSNDDDDRYDASVVLVYGSQERATDRRNRISHVQVSGSLDVQWNQETISIYGNAATFSGPVSATLQAGDSTVSYRTCSDGTTVYRVGYDLFDEVRHLLTQGQTRSRAETPTLELHIEFIRHCLREGGVSFVEIPPRPHEAAFICCLTHDIDFFGLRRHKGDRTLAGFAVRGLFGTVRDLLRGKRSLDEAFRNVVAVLSSPLVFLGVKADPWQPFHDYARADRRHRATYFLIPFKGIAGTSPDGVKRSLRAAPYGIGDIQSEVDAAAGPSVEFAVHGIDAWHDSVAGTAELAALAKVTGQKPAGVRMHWLYFAESSPRKLEEAGFTYDSSWGYNDAVGYRAGTSQAFRLSGTDALLELPLTIMDTAMFYPDRMGLDRQEALQRCRHIVRRAHQFGGAVVVNWHDRSLAPERLWGRSYDELLSNIGDDAWFATADEAVEWFRWRRSIQFRVDSETRTVSVTADEPKRHLPPARIVHHAPDRPHEARFNGGIHTVRS